MTTVEGPVTSVPGISAIETLVTFFLIPTALFVVISVITYALTAPKKQKEPSSITSIA
jgi:hypothetical protein